MLYMYLTSVFSPHLSQGTNNPVHLAEAVQAPNVKLGATAGDQPLHLGTWKGGPYSTKGMIL